MAGWKFENEIRIFSLLRDRAGFEPKTVYDVGASTGGWSEQIGRIFSNADFHLFEPLASSRTEYRDGLRRRLEKDSRLTLHEVALGSRTGKRMMSVTPDGVGSTTLDVGVSEYFPTQLEVDEFTLDEYVAAAKLVPPDLLKLDVQGSEMAILSNAPRTLKNTSLIYAETWLQRAYGPDTPLLTELMDELARHGFKLAELLLGFYHPDHELYACDAIFASQAFLDQFASLMPKATW